VVYGQFWRNYVYFTLIPQADCLGAVAILEAQTAVPHEIAVIAHERLGSGPPVDLVSDPGSQKLT
jgi:hypothetical protein